RMKAVRLQKSEYLLSLTSAEFEDAIAGLYRCQGYSVRQTPYTSDGGFDIVATNEKENLYIECKRFSPTSKIGRPILQKLVGAIPIEDRCRGVLITTSTFTYEAIVYAR